VKDHPWNPPWNNVVARPLTRARREGGNPLGVQPSSAADAAPALGRCTCAVHMILRYASDRGRKVSSVQQVCLASLSVSAYSRRTCCQASMCGDRKAFCGHRAHYELENGSPKSRPRLRSATNEDTGQPRRLHFVNLRGFALDYMRSLPTECCR